MKIEDFSKIGSDLIAESKQIQRSPGEILQEVFPYVYEASRRMSARDISKWFLEKHGYSISQPTISRALRNPTEFWDGFADTIEPVARRIASSLNISMRTVLLDDKREKKARFEWVLKGARPNLPAEEIKEVEEGIEFLEEKWFPLSLGTRRDCIPYFEPDPTAEEMDSDPDRYERMDT